AGKGQPKTGGRQKGVLNHTTQALKDAILEAAEQAHHEGKVGYLKWLATNNSGAFASLLGKVLPLTVAGDAENPLAFKDVTPEARLEAFMAFLAKTAKPSAASH